MKQIIIAVALLISAKVNAQITFNTQSAQIGVWEDKKYRWSEPEEVHFDIVLSESGVSFDNEAQTRLRIVKAYEKTEGVTTKGGKYSSYNFRTIDEDGKSCMFSVNIHKDFILINLIYEDVCLRLYCSKGLDRLLDSTP